jgi:hypothetical protein
MAGAYDKVGGAVTFNSGTVPGLIKTTVEFGIFTVVAYFTESGPLKQFPAKDYKAFCLGCVLYFFVAYWFVMRQGTTKAALNPPEVVNSTDPGVVAKMKNIDRTVGNMLEQMPIFLFVLVPYALFINPVRAGYLLFAYAALTVLYPFLYDMGAPILFASTFPRYFIVYYMAGALMLTSLRT